MGHRTSRSQEESKIVWLSTHVSRDALFLAAQYAPNLVSRVVGSTPDDDTKLLLKVYATEFQYHLRRPSDFPDVPYVISEKRNHQNGNALGTLMPIK